jgi:hypothetical protein
MEITKEQILDDIVGYFVANGSERSNKIILNCFNEKYNAVGYSKNSFNEYDILIMPEISKVGISSKDIKIKILPSEKIKKLVRFVDKQYLIELLADNIFEYSNYGVDFKTLDKYSMIYELEVSDKIKNNTFVATKYIRQALDDIIKSGNFEIILDTAINNKGQQIVELISKESLKVTEFKDKLKVRYYYSIYNFDNFFNNSYTGKITTYNDITLAMHNLKVIE